MSGGSEERNDSGPSHAEREAAALARIVTQRAIRRLDILESVIFLAGAVLATLGGGLAAWILVGIAGWDFRTTWVAASILLFVVPGTIAIIKIKREEREDALRMARTREEAIEDLAGDGAGAEGRDENDVEDPPGRADAREAMVEEREGVDD